MTPERAIEILDPEHREHYDSIEPVNEACRLGIRAIEKCRIPQRVRLTTSTIRCPRCNKQLTNRGCRKDKYKYCRWCGQLLDWGNKE